MWVLEIDDDHDKEGVAMSIQSLQRVRQYIQLLHNDVFGRTPVSDCGHKAQGPPWGPGYVSTVPAQSETIHKTITQ